MQSTNLMMELMREPVIFCSKDGEIQFIAVKKIGAAWIDNKNKFKITLGKACLKPAINFLVDNCLFFNFANISF